MTQTEAKKIGDELKINWNIVNLDQFTKGIDVESEHKDVTGGDIYLTAKIALAHLKEIPDYYTRLIKMEKSAKNESFEEFDLQKLNDLKSFARRKQYCNQFLPLIGLGSSRRVYKYEDKVIKLAANAKGIAQNEIESDGYLRHLSNLAHVLAEADDAEWIISEYAKPITERRFEEIMGYSFKEYADCIFGMLNTSRTLKVPEKFDEIYDAENPYCTLLRTVENITLSLDLVWGDFTKISSYGELNNKVVIIDYGINRVTMDTLYFKKKPIRF